MKGKDIVLRRRYLVQEPLSFATTGGVYKALDQRTGHTVVLKEARPFTYFGEELDMELLAAQRQIQSGASQITQLSRR